jgi:hypothetical protein
MLDGIDYGQPAYATIKPETLERMEADARLIAAAPELLDALERYVHHFGDPLKCARTAIAKATGEKA